MKAKFLTIGILAAGILGAWSQSDQAAASPLSPAATIGSAALAAPDLATTVQYYHAPWRSRRAHHSPYRSRRAHHAPWRSRSGHHSAWRTRKDFGNPHVPLGHNYRRSQSWGWGHYR